MSNAARVSGETSLGRSSRTRVLGRCPLSTDRPRAQRCCGLTVAVAEATRNPKQRVREVHGRANEEVSVVIATRGRREQTAWLLRALQVQTRPPEDVLIIGVTADDIPDISLLNLRITTALSPVAGLTAQRNLGLDLIRTSVRQDKWPNVIFFDDDFRPHPGWLRAAENAFRFNAELVGLSGRVLADGVKGPAVSEAEAMNLLEGRSSPRPHWSAGAGRHIESLYGCNMAIRGEAAAKCRFDEKLPLYGWQEDCDFTGQLRRLGETQLEPTCVGVHLGVKAARSSGVRLGYSQVANPIRIAQRRNMSWIRMVRFVGRAGLANLIKSVALNRGVDHRGRLKGNLLAVADVVQGRCRPERILEI